MFSPPQQVHIVIPCGTKVLTRPDKRSEWLCIREPNLFKSGCVCYLPAVDFAALATFCHNQTLKAAE